MEQEPLTTGQVAEYCHVTYRAVLKWIAEGKLQAYRTPGKHSRVRVEDFIEFLKKYHMPIPEGLSAVSSQKRILIADDDQNVVNLIKLILEADKIYAIEAAYDGFEAGQKFSTFLPDLIILDINMPGVNGYKICSHVRSQSENDHVKILVISGLIGKQETEENIIKLGADAAMAKPFDPKQLSQKVKELIAITKGT